MTRRMKAVIAANPDHTRRALPLQDEADDRPRPGAQRRRRGRRHRRHDRCALEGLLRHDGRPRASIRAILDYKSAYSLEFLPLTRAGDDRGGTIMAQMKLAIVDIEPVHPRRRGRAQARRPRLRRSLRDHRLRGDRRPRRSRDARHRPLWRGHRLLPRALCREGPLHRRRSRPRAAAILPSASRASPRR